MVKKCTLIIFILYLFLANFSVYAEGDSDNGNDIIFDYVFETDMPASTTLLKDSDGFLWMPTQNGLVRYDAYDSVVYRTGENSVSNDYISNIYEDSRGLLWIGTQGGGLDLYNKETNQFTNFYMDDESSNTIASNNIAINPQSIFEDSKGLIWIATSDNGISVYNPIRDEFNHIGIDPLDDDHSLVDLGTWSVIEDHEGYIWVGGTAGLNKIDPRTYEVTKYVNNPLIETSLGQGWVYRILIDKEDPDTFWIGTIGSGLYRFDRLTGEFTQFLHPDGSGDDQIVTMIEDTDNNLWIGWFTAPSFGGLSIFDKDTFTFTDYSHNPNDPGTLDSNQIFGLYQDERDIIWVLHVNSIVEKIDPSSQNFKLYQHIPGDETSISINSLLSYYEDSEGTMWFGGVNSGLLKYDRETDTFKSFKSDNASEHGITSNFVFRIYEDSEGVFYVSMRGGDVVLFDRDNEQTYMRYTNDPNDPTTIGANDSIRFILEDKDDKNTIYMASFLGGFHILDKETQTFRNFPVNPENPDGLTNSILVHIHQDPNTGLLWISTVGGGLIKYDRETDLFETYLHDPDDETSIGSNQVWEVRQYNDKELWLATVGGGLNRFDLETETFERYTKEDGFPANGIMTMQKDDSDMLWLGSDEGLIRFDMATETTKVFTEADGLQGNVFLDAASWHDSENNIWIGGIKGMNMFNPDEIIENTEVPQISLVSLTQANVPLDTDKALTRLSSLEIPWQQNFFEFSFAALNYTLPEKNQYAYMLEGFDKDWYYSGTRRFGRYSSIPPGDYVLRIKASNNEGLWNEEGIAINVRIKPPFYRTTGFIVGISLLIILMMYLGYYLRMRSIKKREKELEHQVMTRTHELEAMHEEEMAMNEELIALNTELNESNEKILTMQEALIQTEKMNALGGLVAGLAHEINTPIGVGITASSNLQALTKEFTQGMESDILGSDERAEYIEDMDESARIIQKNLEKAGRLIRNFKMVSSDQSAAVKRTFNIKEYLNEVVMTLMPMTDKKNIQVIQDCDDYLEMHEDPGLFSQIITNLVQNSVLHGFEGMNNGQINIEIKEIDNTVHFTFRDNGCGMDTTTANKIFEPFYTTKRGEGGTGLGMYIVYSIVTQQFGGNIRCSSTIDEGTVFIASWQVKH